MFKHILLPTDGSELSERALSSGIELAKTIGAKVTGLYALESYPLTFYGEYVPADAFTPEEFESAEHKRANDFLDHVKDLAKQAGVECDVTTVSGVLPHEAIIETATRLGCDLIYMATHGRRGISALLLGSETTKVLTHSSIPVLAYR